MEKRLGRAIRSGALLASEHPAPWQLLPRRVSWAPQAEFAIPSLLSPSGKRALRVGLSHRRGDPCTSVLRSDRHQGRYSFERLPGSARKALGCCYRCAVSCHSLFVLCSLTSPEFSLIITGIYALATSSLSVSSQGLAARSEPTRRGGRFLLPVGWREEHRWVPLAGFLLAYAVITRPTDLLIALPLGVYVIVYRRRHLIGFALGGLPPISSTSGTTRDTSATLSDHNFRFSKAICGALRFGPAWRKSKLVPAGDSLSTLRSCFCLWSTS